MTLIAEYFDNYLQVTYLNQPNPNPHATPQSFQNDFEIIPNLFDAHLKSD